MALTAANFPTFLNVTKSLDPDGKVAVVAEILKETNPILEDMAMVEGNLPTGNVSTIRSGLPTVTFRLLYGGVQPTKGKTVQVTDTTGMMEAYAEIDKALADLSNNRNAYRLSEDRAHIEAMSQLMATTVFFGNSSVEIEKFTGLAPRYSDLSADNADNIIDAGGTGSDNASIWLVGWSDSTVFGIFPQGSVTGLQVEDKGQVTIEDIDGNGGRMEAYRTHYRWDNGLAVKDWRYAVRICNIDRSELTADVSTGANLPNLMFEAMERIPDMGRARFAFYSDRTVLTKIRQQLPEGTKNSTLSIENVGGAPVTMYHGVPIRRTDALAVDEARVT